MAHVNPLLRVGDHEVAVQERLGVRPQALQHRRADREVWHHVPILWPHNHFDVHTRTYAAIVITALRTKHGWRW